MEVRTQPQLLVVEKQIHIQSEEYLPVLWQNAQYLVGVDPKLRFQALEELNKLEVIRYSPLLAYLVATRLSDSETNIRNAAILILVSVLNPDVIGNPAPKEVLLEIYNCLSNISKDTVAKLLMCSIDYEENRSDISKLLNLCSESGKHLASILADRNELIGIRRQAADYIGLIGFVETRPILIRIKNRLESVVKNNTRSPINLENQEEQKSLLLSINTALTLLQNP